MNNHYIRLILIFCMAFVLPKVNAQRIVQDLDRGVVAIHSATNSAFISWRLFATEPSKIGFNLYRSSGGGTPVKLNTTELTQGTNFTDATANFTVSNEYFVKAVLNNVEQQASRSYILPANTPVQSYYSIPLRQNAVPYITKYVRVGDLDGDGDYDFVLVREPVTADPTSPMVVEAYKQDGTYLWQLDCGPNSLDHYNNEPGSSTLDCGHGDNITVYDINEDGKAEVIVRTANGVKFDDGNTITNGASKDVQFISVLNGVTGVEMSRTLYDNPYLKEGPMNGHFGIGYLDGIHPSLVWEAKNRTGDTDFNEMTTTWDWKNGTLVQKWQFLSDNQGGKVTPYGHQMRIIDVDGDGKDEICPQGFVIDDDGKLLYTLADSDIYHGDRFFIGDLDPKRPGLEMYGIQQGYSKSGIQWYYADAKTGEVLLTQKNPGNYDMARGNVGDMDPRFSGYEFHTFTDFLYNVSGLPTSRGGMPSSYPNFKIWWDGDLLTENMDNKKMTKWDYLNDREGRIFIDGLGTFSGHTVGPDTASFAGDILGDWREEAIYESGDFKSLLIYTTPIPTTERIYTLSQNPGYLNCFSVRGYYQGNMTDFYLGDGMQEPPLSPIQKADKYWEGTTAVWDSSSPNWTSKTGNKIYSNGDTVMFDVRGNNTNPIQLNTDCSPAKIIAINPQGKDYVFSGTGKLTGAMEFVKAQLGAITFNGNYDYTGPTTITEGTLNVNGSLMSNVEIGPKGVIGGIGTFKGAVTLKKGFNIDGGKIAPGNGMGDNLIGSLIIEGNLVVPGDNNFAFGIVPASAKINDSLIVKGNLSFSGKNKLLIKFKDGEAKSGIYSLIRCNGTLTANAADFTIVGLDGVPSEILVENNQVKLKILSLRNPGSITWKGSVDNVWDIYKTNFDLNGLATGFTPKDIVKFDETGLLKTVQLSDFANTSGVNFDATSDYTINGTGSIDGNGDLIKNNTNTVTMNLIKNTYTGKTIVNAGTLSISTIDFGGNPSSIGAASNVAGNFVVNNSTLQINNNSFTDRILTITGNTTIVTPNAAKYAMFQGNITGSGNLIKEGPGALHFLYNNSYSGETILKNGSIYLRGALGNVGGLGTLGKLTIESGSLIMEDRRENLNAYWNIVVPSGKSGSFTTDGRCTLNGTLTGAGVLTVNIAYVRTAFRGDWSAFEGSIDVNGDFRLDNTFGYSKATINLVGNGLDGSIPNAYSVTSSRTIKFGELNGVATSKLVAANWEIGAKNTNSVFNGTIVSNLLTKLGTGSLTLTGNNTYTGVTNVNGGQLIVNNTTGSGAGTGILTVNSGGTLKGTGILANVITVANGGTLAPGYPSFGTLTTSKAVTLNSGSFYECDVNSTTDTADILSVGANLLTLNGTLKITNQAGIDYVIGDSFKIFNGSNITGDFTSIVPAVPGVGLVWNTSSLKTTGVISVIADPNLGTAKFNPKSDSELLVYPNPTSGNFKVELNNLNEGEGTINIVTVNGVTVEQRNVSFEKGIQFFSFDIGKLPSGVYFVQIKRDNGTVTKKIVLNN